MKTQLEKFTTELDKTKTAYTEVNVPIPDEDYGDELLTIITAQGRDFFFDGLTGEFDHADLGSIN